jgi:hypothetical protein
MLVLLVAVEIEASLGVSSLGVRLCFWFFIPVEKPRTKSDPLAREAVRRRALVEGDVTEVRKPLPKKTVFCPLATGFTRQSPL